MKKTVPDLNEKVDFIFTFNKAMINALMLILVLVIFEINNSFNELSIYLMGEDSYIPFLNPFQEITIMVSAFVLAIGFIYYTTNFVYNIINK